MLTGRNAQLAAAAHVRGKVDLSGQCTACAEVGVTVYRFDDVLQLAWRSIAYASTDATGNYDVGGLAGGQLRIGFDDGQRQLRRRVLQRQVDPGRGRHRARWRRGQRHRQERGPWRAPPTSPGA